VTSDPQSALVVAFVGIAIGVIGVALGAYALIRVSRLNHS